MNRRTLVKQMKAAAKTHGAELILEREGGNHTVYRVNGRAIPVPRHNEIGETLAKTIIQQVTRAAQEG